jgi:adenine phosphoribosyltransferase
VRKVGKLPWAVAREEYVLEYGTDKLEIHRDAVMPGERVLIVDDVLATGGTASAVVRLVEGLGAEVVGLGFAIELEDLAGRDSLKGYEVESLITY